ncbi:T9SS type A sorting domain-containing protein, partial [bacterium]|nr:T9SS type A sorting domain-containing protein [bacterium]
HNLIFNNTSDWIGGGIELQDTCSPLIINNTIADNTADYGGGIDLYGPNTPEIRNTILWGNTAADAGDQVNIMHEDGVPDFFYCDIEGGQAAFGGFPHTGEYRFCIDADPLFEDTLTGDYHLTENSPCIDTGDPAILDPDSTTSDMGAFYYDQRAITALDASNLTDTSFVANWQEAQDATGYLLDVANDTNFQNFVGDYHNCDVGNTLSHLVSGLTPGTNYYYRVRANYYFGRSGYSDTMPATTLVSINDLAKPSVIHLGINPNPAGRIMNIEYRILNVEVVGLGVFDIYGKEIATLVNETQAAGNYTVRFDASHLPTGIYLIRLQTSNEVVTKKIIKQ